MTSDMATAFTSDRTSWRRFFLVLQSRYTTGVPWLENQKKLHTESHTSTVLCQQCVARYLGSSTAVRKMQDQIDDESSSASRLGTQVTSDENFTSARPSRYGSGECEGNGRHKSSTHCRRILTLSFNQTTTWCR